MKKMTLIALALLVVAACQRVEKKEGENWLGTTTDTTATDTATATHPGSPGGTAIVPEVDAGTTVAVVLEDGAIGAPMESIPPGPAVLTVSNRGNELHNLFIEGEGISRAAGDPISAGETVSVDVTFQAGTYVMYCPIMDHRTKGEEITITVQR